MNAAVRFSAFQDKVIALLQPNRLAVFKSSIRLSGKGHQSQPGDGRLISGGPIASAVLIGLQPGQTAINRALDFVPKGYIRNEQHLSGRSIFERSRHAFAAAKDITD